MSVWWRPITDPVACQLCGRASYLLDPYERPAHPCCVIQMRHEPPRSDCEACLIAESAARRRNERVSAWTAFSVGPDDERAAYDEEHDRSNYATQAEWDRIQRARGH